MPHAALPRLLGVLLAGGLSSRMGTPKALLPHPNGGTFLTHSLNRLQSVCADDVVVNLASQADRDPFRLPASVASISDSLPALGPAMGVCVGMLHAESNGYQGCLFTPVDLPDLLAGDLTSLINTWREQPTKILLARQTDPERLQPLVGIYPVGYLDQIQGVVESKHRSLYRFLQSTDHRTVDLPASRLRNVNTPADRDASVDRNLPSE
ncbi:molybdenum cofactor guanylyltransferase [Rhodopirellula bahusiensis]|uniref:Molybdenum cofactor guanylyltransferase n=1 Tax=Rhodopirellula bahusiensis TaxID=2014065 RepID=A0A2G1WD32_9BACT|nr:molybdenum cofactor guanylyltransferase [Rhodopirellula bahusiensis]PHQ36906.1 molybdenum cofactor guanylyltransferase [Rhodopirellula bahusiensis]